MATNIEELAIEKCKELGLTFVRLDKTNRTRVIFICPKHEKYGEQSSGWSNFRRAAKGCNYCSGKIVTDEMFREIISPNVEPLEEYHGLYNKIKCKCKLCGDTWEVTPASLKNGSACPKCGKEKAAKSRRKSQAQFEQEVSELHPHIKILGKYRNNKKKVKCLCTKHNQEFESQPVHLLFESAGCTCPDCYAESVHERCAKTQEQFEKEVHEVFPQFEVLGTYVNCETKIRMRCKEHDIEFDTIPNDVVHGGNSCPMCGAGSSRPEQTIYKYLLEEFGEVERQKMFDGCVCVKRLKFDFYLPKLNVLIEYDGEGHYWAVPFGGMSEESAKKQFENTHKRDLIKNEYCEKNNIPLIRIPYWEFKNYKQYIQEALQKINCLS